jgi:hypothetical protein
MKHPIHDAVLLPFLRKWEAVHVVHGHRLLYLGFKIDLTRFSG